MTLDMKTALVAVLFIIAMCLVVTLQLWFQNRSRYHGLNYWVASCFFLLAGVILVVLRQKIPDWASIVLGNCLLASGALITFFGLCRFAGKKTHPLLNYSIWIIFALYAFVHCYFTFIQDDFSARMFNTACGLLLAGFLCIWLMFKGAGLEIRRIARGAGIALVALMFILFLGIIGLKLQPPAGNELLKSGWFEIFMVLLLACSAVFIVFNLSLMVNRRIYMEARQMEAAAKQSESRLRATLQTTSVGFAILTNGIVKEMNDAGCHMLGYSREELIGQDVRIIHPSEQAYQKIRDIYTRLPETGTVTAEVQILRKNGGLMHTIMNVSALDKNNISAGVVASVVDISERKRAEESVQEERQRLQSIIEGTGVGTWEWNVQTGETVYNERWAQIVGYNLAELSPTTIKTWESLVHSDDLKKSNELLVRHFAGELTGYDVECRIKHKDGHWVWVHDRGRIFTRTANGKPLMMFGTHTDITRRKEAEVRLRELYEKEKTLREEMEKEARARAMFIDILAHELKTPLTPMLSSSELLNELVQKQNETIIQKLAANIYSSAMILNKRLSELLDMARYARGTFKLNPEPTDFSLFISGVVSRYQPTLEQSCQTLTVNMDHDLPEISLDPSRMEQVIVNLLSNANKFSSPGSSIYLAVKRKGDLLHINVKDSGIGISREEQKNLFEPYHRVLQDRNQYPGTGLGLAICKQIVQSHGGKIWVESEIGKGSTFTFEIPLKDKR